MAKIDAHQHFWNFDPVRDSWIDEKMAVIQKDFLPEDLQPVLQQYGFDGCVTVQSDQTPTTNSNLLAYAEAKDFIKGVVGWVDFQAGDVADQLSRLQEFPKLKGFRYVLQGEPQRDFMLRPDFLRGIGQLKKFGFTYDVLIYPDQLPYTETFVAAFPDQPFVIDHLAKPHIKEQKITDWARDLKAVAAHENLMCKVSGMVTEADWHNRQPSDFRPYLDTLVEAFGTDRLMFGSDWPVCLVAASYGEVLGIVEGYFSSFSETEQTAIFGGNASTFYNLD